MIYSGENAVAVWRSIDAALAPIIGHKGVAALFYRCVQLASPDHPWLIGIRENQERSSGLPFASLDSLLARQSAAEAAIASRLLLGKFREQLARLVGDSLTERLLRPGGIDIFTDDSFQDAP